jgi:hypothetical protein
LDGELDASASPAGGFPTNDRSPINDPSVSIGSTGFGPEWNGHFWNGLIDDVRIYSYALSEAEVKEVYAGRGPGPKKRPQ